MKVTLTMSNDVQGVFKTLPLREQVKLLKLLSEQTMQEAFQSNEDIGFNETSESLNAYFQGLTKRVSKVTKPLQLVPSERLNRNYRPHQNKYKESPILDDLCTEWEQIKNSKFDNLYTENEQVQKMLNSLDSAFNSMGYHASSHIELIRNNLKRTKTSENSEATLTICKFVDTLKRRGASAAQSYVVAEHVFNSYESFIKKHYLSYKKNYPEYIEPDGDIRPYELSLFAEVLIHRDFKFEFTANQPNASLNKAINIANGFFLECIETVKSASRKVVSNMNQKYQLHSVEEYEPYISIFESNNENAQEFVMNYPKHLGMDTWGFIGVFEMMLSGEYVKSIEQERNKPNSFWDE